MVPSTYFLSAALVATGLLAAAASGDNCTFRADPETVLEREHRARREAEARTLRLVPSLQKSNSRPAATAAEIPWRNFVDEEIFGTMLAAGVRPAPLATDQEFVRRIYLDLTGRLPAPAQIREFLADTNPARRDALIDRLLFSPEFTDRWTMWLGDLVQNNRTAFNVNQQTDGRNAMHGWLRESIAHEKSFADVAFELITSGGNNYDYGPANFSVKSITPGGPVQDRYDAMMVRTATAFLGLGHYDCLMCHDGRRHTDQVSLWATGVTRMDAYRMAAHFSRMDIRGRGNTAGDPYANSFDVSDRPTGNYALNTNFGNRPNRVRVGSSAAVDAEYRNGQTPKAGASWRESFARQVAADPMFARNLANRLFKQVFNVGLVEPVDMLDPARLDPKNPPPAPWAFQATHPKLLERLAGEMSANWYSLRETLRVLVSSNAYQLSARYEGEWKAEYAALFARHFARRLEAEEIHDAIVQATGVFTNHAIGGWADPVRWAWQMPDTQEPLGNAGNARVFMDVFLRGNRDTQPRSQANSILQQLSLMNDSFVLNRIRATASPVIQNMLKIADPRALADEMFLTFLARYPTDGERAKVVAYLAKYPSAQARTAAVEDLAWALINKTDFLFSY